MMKIDASANLLQQQQQTIQYQGSNNRLIWQVHTEHIISYSTTPHCAIGSPTKKDSHKVASFAGSSHEVRTWPPGFGWQQKELEQVDRYDDAL